MDRVTSDPELDRALEGAGLGDAPALAARAPAEPHVPVAEFAACVHCRRVLSATMLREETERDAEPPPRALLTEAAYCQRCGRPRDSDAPLSAAAGQGFARLARRLRAISPPQRRARQRLYGDEGVKD